MEQFLHYVTTDHAAGVIFLAMIGLAIFGLSVIGGAIHRVARRVGLMRSRAKERKAYELRRTQLMQHTAELHRTGQPTSVADAKHGGLSYAQLAERAFNRNSEVVHQDTGSYAAIQN